MSPFGAPRSQQAGDPGDGRRSELGEVVEGDGEPIAEDLRLHQDGENADHQHHCAQKDHDPPPAAALRPARARPSRKRPLPCSQPFFPAV